MRTVQAHRALRLATLHAGDRYDGEFRDGQEDGIGIFTWADGSTYNGFWCGGLKQGVGVYRPASTDNKRATAPAERHATQPAASELAKPSPHADGEAELPSPRGTEQEGGQTALPLCGLEALWSYRGWGQECGCRGDQLFWEL